MSVSASAILRKRFKEAVKQNLESGNYLTVSELNKSENERCLANGQSVRQGSDE
jgi:hypothetical protein